MTLWPWIKKIDFSMLSTGIGNGLEAMVNPTRLRCSYPLGEAPDLTTFQESALVRSPQNKKPHLPCTGKWGFAYGLFGAFVSHPSSISMRRSRSQTPGLDLASKQAFAISTFSATKNFPRSLRCHARAGRSTRLRTAASARQAKSEARNKSQ
jgi:hypothetical protein